MNNNDSTESECEWTINFVNFAPSRQPYTINLNLKGLSKVLLGSTNFHLLFCQTKFQIFDGYILTKCTSKMNSDTT